jgi:radical SAM-linked protein
MRRLLFEKYGRAVWISHLDLMRLFQRAFKRAGLLLKHTQGYNPRPSVSIALPLSVGVESHCELLDFELEGEPVSNEEVLERLNPCLVDGVRGLQVYDDGDKLKNLALLDCTVTLEYDRGIPVDGVQQLELLFKRESLPVEKKSKNGVQEQDIIPMIHRLEVAKKDEGIVEIKATICCQNPTLNPAQLIVAIQRYLPEMEPDYFCCCRNEIYDTTEKIFR